MCAHSRTRHYTDQVAPTTLLEWKSNIKSQSAFVVYVLHWFYIVLCYLPYRFYSHNGGACKWDDRTRIISFFCVIFLYFVFVLSDTHFSYSIQLRLYGLFNMLFVFFCLSFNENERQSTYSCFSCVSFYFVMKIVVCLLSIKIVNFLCE